LSYITIGIVLAGFILWIVLIVKYFNLCRLHSQKQRLRSDAMDKFWDEFNNGMQETIQNINSLTEEIRRDREARKKGKE
jgi:hypothetical protein